MAYDLEEQEQLENLKSWWKDNGNWVMGAVTVVLLVFAGWNGWNWWQVRQAGEAAQLYEEVQKAVSGKDVPRIQRVAADMRDKYARTTYAQMTALQVASALQHAGKGAEAKEQLQWLVDNAKNDEYQHLARLRLASLLIDDKAFDAALKLMAGEPPAAFAVLYAERRGDVLWGQGKAAEARVAYQQALEKTGARETVLRQLLQLKLDAVSGA